MIKYFYLGDSLINWDNVTSIEIDERESENWFIRVNLTSGNYVSRSVKSKEIAEEWREKTITSLLIS